MGGIVDRDGIDRLATDGDRERVREEGTSLVSEGVRREGMLADLQAETDRAAEFAARTEAGGVLEYRASAAGGRARQRVTGPADQDNAWDPAAWDGRPGPFDPARSLTGMRVDSPAPPSASVSGSSFGTDAEAPSTAAVDAGPLPGSGDFRDGARAPRPDGTGLATRGVTAREALPEDQNAPLAREAPAAREAGGVSRPSVRFGSSLREARVDAGRAPADPLGAPSISERAAAVRATTLAGTIRTQGALSLVSAAEATLLTASSGARDLAPSGLSDDVTQSAGSGLHTFAFARAQGMSLRASAASALVAASGSEELADAEGAYRRADLAARAGRGVWRHLLADGRREEVAGRIKHRYQKRLAALISRKRRSAEVVTGQGAALRAETTVRAIATTASTVTKGGGLLWALGPAALAILGIVLALVLLMGAAAGAEQPIEGLGPNAAAMAQYLRDAGWDDTHVAAAVGNSIYESGGDQAALEVDPAHEGDLSGVGHYGYEVNCGIFSWTDTRPGSGVMTTMKTYAQMQGKAWQDLEVQLDFFLQVYLPSRSQAAVDRWFAITSLDEATKVMVSPSGGILSGWAGAVQGEVLQTRLDLARRVYSAITNGGSGEEYAASSEVQRAIVDAAMRTPSPGSGLCAMWVSQVYQAAGLGYIGGNADDMYYAYCTSSDRSRLKVGMLIGTPSNPYTTASQLYGHVGIYIGDGKVMSNLSGSIKTQSLDDFIAVQGVTHQVRWGFPPNVSI